MLISVMKEDLEKKAEEVAAVLKQLAHPTRLKLLCGLLDGEKTVGELVESLSEAQSWVSQILSRMKLEGLVEARKEGSFVYYRIADPRLDELMKSIYQIYCTPSRRRKAGQS